MTLAGFKLIRGGHKCGSAEEAESTPHECQSVQESASAGTLGGSVDSSHFISGLWKLL